MKQRRRKKNVWTLNTHTHIDKLKIHFNGLGEIRFAIHKFCCVLASFVKVSFNYKIAIHYLSILYDALTHFYRTNHVKKEGFQCDDLQWWRKEKKDFWWTWMLIKLPRIAFQFSLRKLFSASFFLLFFHLFNVSTVYILSFTCTFWYFMNVCDCFEWIKCELQNTCTTSIEVSLNSWSLA